MSLPRVQPWRNALTGYKGVQLQNEANNLPQFFILSLLAQPLPPGRIVEQADFVEASYPGYNPQPAVAIDYADFGLAGSYARDTCQIGYTRLKSPTSGGPVVVYGWGLRFSHSSVVYWLGGANFDFPMILQQGGPDVPIRWVGYDAQGGCFLNLP